MASGKWENNTHLEGPVAQFADHLSSAITSKNLSRQCNGGSSNYANTKWWDMALLEQIFSREERVAIQSIPISNTDQVDVQIWQGTKNGIFLVRSAYHISKECEMVHKAGGSLSTPKKMLWNSIWQLQIPNVEKHFLWRACHEILPTKDNLCTRRVVSDPSCPICEREPETTFSCLVAMPSSERCLECRGKNFPKKLV